MLCCTQPPHRDDKTTCDSYKVRLNSLRTVITDTYRQRQDVCTDFREASYSLFAVIFLALPPPVDKTHPTALRVKQQNIRGRAGLHRGHGWTGAQSDFTLTQMKRVFLLPDRS